MTWWHYLILVNFYLVLFFGFYALLLRKETFFQLNRIYLVSAALLSFCIPLIQAEWVKNLFITQRVQQTIYGGTLEAIYTVKPAAAVQSTLTLGEIINAIYITVTLFLILRLMWQLLILKKAIERPSPSAAYSFFKKISLGENVSHSSVIAEHEAVHAGQWHSIDVMIIETVMIINWFNPVVYLYRFAIKYIHEFIADLQVIERGTDKVDYALLLLSQTFNTDTHKLVTPFYNHSLLKERIKMLQKNKSHRIMLTKYGLSAPLFILMMILSSATVKNSRAITVLNKRTEKALKMPAADVVDIVTDNVNVPAGNKAKQPDRINKTVNGTSANISKTDTIPDKKVFSQVESQPVFPGGLDGFMKFLSSTVHYPQADRNNKVEGMVIVTFIVEKDGSLSEITAVRGPSETLKQAAVDALLKSPKWKPGYQNGHAVRVSYTVPVKFNLSQAEDKVYTQVDKQPMFPGGMDAFLKFLGNTIRYPKEDRENGVSGRVICNMVVEKDGSLSNIHALRGPSETINAEAVRALSISPKWAPGISKDGNPVRVSYTVPINFTLDTEDDATPRIKLDSLLKSKQIGKNSPLYIVDGVEYKTGMSLSDIKQEDIQSIEILKDQTATRLYGDRGKYGVIIVTTKKKK
ncbi:TonB family protein [Mucilaginibacter panaciglaebae]|uniref:TonB C-terminal domain-containing protein n=1 Tax=Mucilaginibacter panaciglaebae TaxID=502331 RepID=A0ABP7X0T5_9SPHI